MKRYTKKEAFQNADQAAKGGNPSAQNFVGYCYNVGKGVGRNMKMAVYWYRKAAQNRNIDDIFYIAFHNDNGSLMLLNDTGTT